ncbi:MAG: aminodeoxychorismate/anthranilate synthase component II [Bacteroidales bacterium]
MKVLIIDNHDSFTYNIAHIVRACKLTKLEIKKPDELRLSEINDFDRIIFSPGPDLPSKGNVMELVLEAYQAEKRILGICLGLQAVVLFYGGQLEKLEEVVHGMTKVIKRTGAESTVLKDIPSDFIAGFYHSWVADRKKMPACLELTCHSDEGRVMGIRHRDYDIEAVQFHPESVMTPLGVKMIENWLVDGMSAK